MHPLALLALLLSLPLSLARPAPLSHSTHSNPNAHPVPRSPSTRTIPLQKSFSLSLPDGALDIGALLAQADYLNGKYALALDLSLGVGVGGGGLGIDTSKLEARVGRSVGRRGRQRGRAGRRQDAANGTGDGSPYGHEGGTGLTDYRDLMWYGPVKIGSEGQQFMMDFDTGSADMFVAGWTCPNCGNHTKYRPANSTTSAPTGQNFTLKYGDGSTAAGVVYTDSVSLAGFTATSQAVGMATWETGTFASDVSSGLLGLAYPALSAYNATPFFPTLVAQQAADPSASPDSAVFAFKLARSGSELWLGGPDAPFVQGPVDWTPVTAQRYWEVAVAALRVGEDAVAASNFSAIVDTGTTLVIGSAAAVGSFYALIPGSAPAGASLGEGFYTFPCNATLPGFTLEFAQASEGRAWELDPGMFNLGPIAQGSELCVGGVVSQGNYPFWIVGDVFLMGKSVLFDMGRNRVGVAGVVGSGLQAQGEGPNGTAAA